MNSLNFKPPPLAGLATSTARAAAGEEACILQQSRQNPTKFHEASGHFVKSGSPAARSRRHGCGSAGGRRSGRGASICLNCTFSVDIFIREQQGKNQTHLQLAAAGAGAVQVKGGAAEAVEAAQRGALEPALAALYLAPPPHRLRHQLQVGQAATLAVGVTHMAAAGHILHTPLRTQKAFHARCCQV